MWQPLRPRMHARRGDGRVGARARLHDTGAHISDPRAPGAASVLPSALRAHASPALPPPAARSPLLAVVSQRIALLKYYKWHLPRGRARPPGLVALTTRAPLLRCSLKTRLHADRAPKRSEASCFTARCGPERDTRHGVRPKKEIQNHTTIYAPTLLVERSFT